MDQPSTNQMSTNDTSSQRPRQYLRVIDAARYCCFSKSAFDKKRLVGDGPPFIKVGNRVIYSIEDLDAWLARHRVRSTSQPRYEPG